jgi:hypothetical protein
LDEESGAYVTVDIGVIFEIRLARGFGSWQGAGLGLLIGGCTGALIGT